MPRNDEQNAAYRAGLETEKKGYEQKVADAKVTEDTASAKLYTNLIAQVDAELAKLDNVDGETSSLSPADKLAKAKNADQLDALASELGFEFDPATTTNKAKKEALEAHLDELAA
jgi:hypothetical protein